MNHSRGLEQLFEQCFFRQFRTRLVGFAPEPLYQPAADETQCHTIYYREDFFASALHEVAHWCIAGSRRRRLVDYGYWYQGDGRDAVQQAEFEQAERQPQALEWHFALACGRSFQVSSDNLQAGTADNCGFLAAVAAQAELYRQFGLPARAAQFRDALATLFRGIAQPGAQVFSRGGVSKHGR